MNYAEWFAAIGEFVIAAIIFWEMEVNRREKFLDQAAEYKNYEDRGTIYSAFYDTSGDSIEEKSVKFCRRIWRREKHEDEEIDLLKRCERQIVLFGRLGQIRRRAFVYKGDYVKLFPHAVVLFWIMVRPYIEERRAQTGDWWARDFEYLTKKCLEFLVEKEPNAQLTLYDPDRDRHKDLGVTTAELRRLQDKLNHSKPI